MNKDQYGTRTPDVGFHVRDRRQEVHGYVHRALLRTALGESYVFDVHGVLVPEQAPGEPVRMNPGYVVSVAAPLPALGTSRQYAVSTSAPFAFTAGEAHVGMVVNECVGAVRRAIAEWLKPPNVP